MVIKQLQPMGDKRMSKDKKIRHCALIDRFDWVDVFAVVAVILMVIGIISFVIITLK